MFPIILTDNGSEFKDPNSLECTCDGKLRTKIFYCDPNSAWDNVTYDYKGRLNKPTFCESTLFSMIKAGLLDSDQILKLYDTIMDDSFICCRASGGLELSIIPVMLLEKGRVREALELYKDVWGSPINAGATTCGEKFFRGSGNSDCHIHGAFAARDFLEYIAGIKIRSPFWNEVLLVPPSNSSQLPDINATVPTYYGNINVKILSENGHKKYLYSVPENCKCFVKLGENKIILSSNIGELTI